MIRLLKMKKTFVLIWFLGCWFVVFGQNQICVDGSSSGSQNGSASNPYRAIQTAVDAASNGDIIKVARGTYTEAVRIEQKKVQLLGGYAGSGNFTTANPQANATVIQGTSTAPCIRVNIDASPAISGSLIINGFTIRNGQRGIELSGGWSEYLNNITIEDNIIENNGTQNLNQYGGGIGLEGINVRVINNIIRNNEAGKGAAIGVTSDLTDFLIDGNRIENNTGYNDHAGGIAISGTGTITRNIFDGNIASAYYNNYGWGGAILIFGDHSTTTKVAMSHNVYRNNHAPSRGGAVFVDDGASVTMEHELLYNNTADKESGSAIYVDNLDNLPSVLNMNNCTVSGNSTNGAAMFVNGSIVQVENSIFWNNGGDFEFTADGISSAKLTVAYTLTQQGYTGTGNISANPLFANAAGGDFHLQSTNGRYNPANGLFVNDGANSPAIDAGNPASDYANEPNPNGGRVNMGCYGNTTEASKSATSGNETVRQASWNVFPNPAKESITIGPLEIGSRVVITDLGGKNVYGAVAENERMTVHTGGFAKGVYVVQVMGAGGRKLMVCK